MRGGFVRRELRQFPLIDFVLIRENSVEDF